VSGLSNNSARKIRNVPISNSPADIARRKVEEALQFGDKEVEHDGSTAALALARKFHMAPERPFSQSPSNPGKEILRALSSDRGKQWS
jgi:hypothetical protein